MSQPSDTTMLDEEKLLAATMSLAASAGWVRCTLTDIAAAAGVDENTLRGLHPDTSSILRALLARIDREALAAENVGDDDDIPPRERLLELLMLRFDAMQPYRAGIVAVARSAVSTPSMALQGGCALTKSMGATLAAAGIPNRGLAGLVRAKALSLIFLDAVRVWAQDDSPDLSATLRRLDERLGQAENLALTLGLAKPVNASV